MQNSHLEFNTSSCLWKGVGLLPYLNHQYDFIPETSRPVYTGKTHHHHFSPTPFHYWHMHFMSSSPQVPGPTWSFLLNLLLGSIFNGISFQRSYRIQKTQRPIQHFDVWKCPNSLLIYIRNCFWWRCSRRSWANAASEVDASQNGILPKKVHFDILNVWSISPTNIPRILHFNSGSQAVPTWKLLGVSVTFMWFAGKLR